MIFSRMGITRREILVGLAGLGGTALVIPRVVLGEIPAPADLAFGSEQRKTLAAAVDRLIPGAVEAGVPEYMDYWLVQEAFKPVGNYLTHGAKHLDRVSGKLHQKKFVDCKAEQQDTVIKKFAAREIKAGKFNGFLFYQQLMELTIEGFLSDPKYGGNKDRAGWRFIGIPDGLRSCWWNPRGVSNVLSPDEGFHD
ncbi:MAG: gluconate 2-dehydrogenase subunit 3 family protein [Deltaproteobacteria bacterium]|nr:gluconate 2-dehydrogenase subunit 3 family protein [Deltaproteobacteria bacterium]